MRYLFRTRWAALNLIQRVGLGFFIVSTTYLFSTIQWGLLLIAWTLNGVVIYADWNYLKGQDRLNAPLIDFAMITAPLIAEHDEVVIYRHDGEYKFLAINHDEEEQAP